MIELLEKVHYYSGSTKVSVSVIESQSETSQTLQMLTKATNSALHIPYEKKCHCKSKSAVVVLLALKREKQKKYKGKKPKEEL